ncbi:hypothetical protein D3C86_1298770 [compost metagenome]
MQGGGLGGGLDIADAPGADGQAVLGDQPVQFGGDLGGDAVAVNVPPGAQMAQEAGAFGLGRRTPQVKRDRAIALHEPAPAVGLRQPPRDRQTHGQRTAQGLGGQVDRRVVMWSVRPGQEAAPRHRRRPAAPALAGKRQQDIDHGQASAEDQDIVVAADGRQGVGRPGVGDDAPAFASRGGARRRVAGGQDDGAPLDPLSRGKDHGLALYGEDGAVHAADQAGMGDLGRAQPVADIEAVEAARREAVGIGPVGMMRPQPVDEVAGLVRRGAHAPGADVQPVRVILRGVGDARTEGVAALDQDRRLSALGQPGRQHGAGKAAADNDHGQGGGVVHRLTSPAPAAFVKSSSDFLIEGADFGMGGEARLDLFPEQVAHVVGGAHALDHDDQFRLVA